MKPLITVILLATTVHAQSLDHDIITGDLALITNGYEVFITNQPDRTTVLKFNENHSKKDLFELVDDYVNSHIDIVYYSRWTRHSENDNVFVSAVSVKKHLYLFYYGINSKRFIIYDMKTRVDRLASTETLNH